MVEPLSAVGFALGTSLALTGFLVSTLDRLNEKGRAFRKCSYFIAAAEASLENTQAQFNSWRSEWNNENISDDEYSDILGLRMFSMMQHRISLLEFDARDVEKCLRSGGSLNVRQMRQPGSRQNNNRVTKSKAPERAAHDVRFDPPSAARWEEWTSEVLGHRYQVVDQGFTKKIAFTLWKSEELKDALGRMQKASALLSDISNIALADLQRLRLANGSAPSLHLERVLRIREQSKAFSWLLAQLYSGVTEHAPSYGVVLRKPDDLGEPECLRDEGDLLVEMLVANAGSGIPVLRKVRIPFPCALPQAETYHSRTLLAALSGHLKGRRRSPDPSSEPWPPGSAINLRMSMESAESSTSESDARLTKMTARERALTAWSLSNWMLLLWTTPWAQDICSCCVVRHVANGGGIYAVLTKARGHPVGGCHMNAITDEDLAALDMNTHDTA
ncbi:hypothetical protein LTR56_019174 [Elasticomyces elasticus]|nr:hypothetical protein LTR22_023691 [Elasticomyces elasticus]KAK3627488.1 hypothetical protein LTR56_019174 [Elasticomyces elasticus]KAK4917217.1 hypothetical protein LTR49_014838 [Elasticomyces elasticus]KAK5746716.1 hypothetical protein LTS12_022654 [Elasticomyces elasticus]